MQNIEKIIAQEVFLRFRECTELKKKYRKWPETGAAMKLKNTNFNIESQILAQMKDDTKYIKKVN